MECTLETTPLFKRKEEMLHIPAGESLASKRLMQFLETGTNLWEELLVRIGSDENLCDF